MNTYICKKGGHTMNIQEILSTLEKMKVTTALYSELEDLQAVHDALESLSNDAYDRIDELESFDIKTEDEAIESYNNMLNECYPTDEAQSWRGSASESMKQNDPVMYRTGFNDYMDSIKKDGRCVPDCTEWSV